MADGLRQSLAEGRRKVALIVGRDTAAMDAPAISRAAIESAAENLSDGVIAPLFWYLVAGLPGLMLYKITNTADSMIGHRTPGTKNSAGPPRGLTTLRTWSARLTALLLALAHWRPDASRVILRDAPLHRSPNAGWPEAAMAVVLGVSLSGPRSAMARCASFPGSIPKAAAIPARRRWMPPAARCGGPGG